MCFGFDYRGFGDSEGEMGRVIIDEQIRDIRHALSYISADPRINSERLFLVGWGMGAGLVLDAAYEFPGIAGLAMINGFYDGTRFQLAHRGNSGFAVFKHEVEEDRRIRAQTGETRKINPFYMYPMDPETTNYVDSALRATPQYNASSYSFEFADSLLRWTPDLRAPAMTIPAFIAHGDRNLLHPPEEARLLFKKYAGPKELFWVEDAGHTEWMWDDNPKFRVLAASLSDWITRQLKH